MYDKKHSCFYCEKEFSKIARHLEQVHKEEDGVKIALQYKSKDEKRVCQFEKLCRMGNYNHNMKVLDLDEGELKVVRRPPSNTSPNISDYLPCKYCYGFFPSDELWRHGPKCPFNEDEENTG